MHLLIKKVFSQVQKMQKHKIFDMNIHLTPDKTFMEYALNMPCTFNTYQESIKSSFDFIGGLIVGLPNVGSYSHNKQYKISKKINCPALAAITNSCLKNMDTSLKKIKDIGFIGVKYHQRLLDASWSSNSLKDVALLCEKHDLILAICTYEKESQKKSKILPMLKDISSFNIKIILMHSGGVRFLDFYNFSLSKKNIILDTSFTLKRYEDTGIITDIIKAINDDSKRIVFGSDFPDYNLEDYKKSLDKISAFIKTPSIEENFTYKNALNFLGPDSIGLQHAK